MTPLLRSFRALAATAALLAAPLFGRAADWPQWRGPSRDGTVRGFKLPETWPKTLTEVWKLPVGEGHSSPILVEGRLFVFSREKDDEIIRCLDAATGREAWHNRYPAPYEMHPAAVGHGKGPKSTPTVQGGKVYTFGISGILSCLDARSGELRWRKDFAKDFPHTSPLYGTAMSPLVEGGLCIAHVGGHDKGALTAFDTDTGTVKWTATSDGPGYASPILTTLAGERQIVTQTQNHVVGISSATGRLLWEVLFKTGYDQNSITPTIYKDLIIYSGYLQPLTALRVGKKADTFEAPSAWSNRDVPLYLSSPVLHGNLLFGMSSRGSRLFCLDADTGKLLWQNEGGMGPNVALLNAGEVLALLTTEAKLIFIKPSATKYEPVAEYKVSDSPTWAHPVLDGDQIWIKDKTSLRCLAFKN